MLLHAQTNTEIETYSIDYTASKSPWLSSPSVACVPNRTTCYHSAMHHIQTVHEWSVSKPKSTGIGYQK